MNNDNFFKLCFQWLCNFLGLSTDKRSDLSQEQKLEKKTSTNSQEKTEKQSITQIKISEKNCLILVIRASNISLVNNIKNKGKIDQFDCENLYQSTIYLNYDNEDNFLKEWQPLVNEKRFYISNEQEYSDADIFLIKIKLKNTENRFNPNLDQIERHDAFMNLANLAIDVEVSERLDMEAYQNFKVY